MITTFDSLYAGHVDMEARNLARLLDRCGHDTFWLAEHHFQREGYECIPNVLLLALDLAHQTERLNPGLERVSVSHPMGASESMMLEQLEWFAAEVMPAFTRRAR